MPRSPTPVAYFLSAALIGAVLASHWPALSARAISFDDDYYVVDNPLVQHPSFESAWRFLAEVRTPSTVPGYYQPLSMISLMLDWAAGGRPQDPFVFHRTSLVLHIVNMLLVGTLLLRLFGDPWAAGAAALLFGVHPLAVESVCWIGERKTLLATGIALWCLIAYVGYARRPRRAGLAGVTCLFVMALLAKPSIMPLPVLLLLLDAWPLRRLGRSALLEKIPLFVIAAASAVVTLLSQGATAEVTLPGERAPGFVPMLVCHDVVFYLWNIVWPSGVSAYYPFPSPFNLSQPSVLIGVMGTALLLVVAAASLRRTRSLAVGFGFFLVALFPTIGVVGFYPVIAADRHVYFPLIGLLLPLAAALVSSRGFDLKSPRKSLTNILARVPLYACLLAAIPLGIQTHRTAAQWHDTESLFRYMLTVAPQAAALQDRLGVALLNVGRPHEAIPYLQAATTARAHSATFHRHLAQALLAADRLADAKRAIEKAIRLDPDSAPIRDVRDEIVRELGKAPDAD